MSGERVGKVLERVAQQIVFCNCATEGPALKRCEHVSLAAALEERLGPLLRSVEALPDKWQNERAIDYEPEGVTEQGKGFEAALRVCAIELRAALAALERER